MLRPWDNVLCDPSARHLCLHVVIFFHSPREQHLYSESLCPLLCFMLVIKQLTCIVFQESHFTPAKINDKILTAQVSEPMGQMDIWYQNI